MNAARTHLSDDDPLARLTGPGGSTFRSATLADAPAITRLVEAAYTPYVERIGTVPGPLRADYRTVLAESTVHVAELHGEIVGVLVTAETTEDHVIDNVAVHPRLQGHGLGAALLTLAEERAERAGLPSLRLYTHELMADNLERYRRRGYVEYARQRLPDGGHLVHLRKPLAAAT
jgi:ribosomal protein S18 acetylase RimI-like enzyme